MTIINSNVLYLNWIIQFILNIKQDSNNYIALYNGNAEMKLMATVLKSHYNVLIWLKSVLILFIIIWDNVTYWNVVYDSISL